FVTLAMIGHPRMAEGFFPSYVDHHGLLTVAVLGVVLGATFMGAGWWRPNTERPGGVLPSSTSAVRRAAVFSALSGALGLWVSAASVIAPLAIVGAAAVVTLFVQGRKAQGEGARFDSAAWRLWGRVGAGASLFFYLLEYFPSHLGLRLESNHPFYALAWWGGGELIAGIGERWLGEPGARWTKLSRLIAPVLAIMIAPLTIVLGGTRVFVVMDPFLAELHRDYIQEFLPLWKTIRGTGWSTFFSVVGFENLPLLAAVATLAVGGRRSPLLLWYATLTAAFFTGMAWIQSRWLLNASGSQVALAVVLLVYFIGNRKTAIRWMATLATALVVFLPSAFTRIMNSREDIKMRRVSPKDAQLPLARDIAAAIRASAPNDDIVLLASPNASTAVGYYGRFKTLGTLYWENVAGLKAAAMSLSARSQEESAELIRKYGVTHIAMISEENFIEQYYRLLHPGATNEDVKKSFGYQLLAARVIPPWLQMIPYKVPDDLSSLNITVLLFKVAFEQTPADALYHIALGKIALGLLPDAERDLDTLIQQSPASYQPWMRKGELLLARHDWAGAATAMIDGISRAPADQRPGLFAVAARSFYNQNQPAQAIRLYRVALKDRFDPNIAAYLAFILATSSDDALRDGREAGALAVQALQTDPNSPSLLNAWAAALAENGRYQEAVAVADRAIANARLNGDTATQRVTEERLTIFKSGKPLRK
ncbi:MAG: hypothetical protein ACREF9_16105, partial [Opitutaceae bacterium]